MMKTSFQFIGPQPRGDFRAWLKDTSLLAQGALVNGRSIVADDDGVPVYDPATTELVGSVPRLNESHIAEAIDAATSAGALWRKVPARERANCLYALYQAMLVNAADLAHVVSFEQGRSLKEARMEVAYAASFVRWYAEECERINNYGVPSAENSYKQYVHMEPVGPVLAITPWNAPCSMITRKLAPAIAAGCSVIVKPSELTPFSALAIGQLCSKAGFPPGLVQIVTGDAESIVSILLDSPRIRKLSFTGSTAVGKQLAAKAASAVKRISLELGGNAPFIIRADADVRVAVDAALVAKFRVGGQSCIAANRFIVHRSRWSDFQERLAAEMHTIVVGDGLAGADLGPIISQRELSRLTGAIEGAKLNGAEIVLGGGILGDNFLEPTLIACAAPSPNRAEHEWFGPVVQMFPFDSDDEAIELANATDAGLAAYVISADTTAAMEMVAALDVGMAGINTGLISDAAIPFGGTKGSGIGREGGKAGIREFLEPKYVRVASNQY